MNRRPSPAPRSTRTADVSAYVAKIVAKAPPLSPAQRDRLATLLREPAS